MAIGVLVVGVLVFSRRALFYTESYMEWDEYSIIFRWMTHSDEYFVNYIYHGDF